MPSAAGAPRARPSRGGVSVFVGSFFVVYVRLPLHAVVRDAGTFLVDALRVTLVAWKRGEKDDEQRPAAPILCPPPAGRVVKVVRK